MTFDLVICGSRVVTPDAVGPAAIHIRNGIITAVEPRSQVPEGCPVYDAGDSVVMPGLVDTHVHINEPGRAEWEGFHAATRAAAAGGVTTLVDMPLNSIPATTTPEALQVKLAAARGHCWVDVGFWGGVVPGNTPHLRRLYDGGVLGFKCFLVPSGVAEFAHVTEADLEAALTELAALGAVLLIHAEVPGPIDAAQQTRATSSPPDPRRYSTFLTSRPRAAENEAVALVVRHLQGMKHMAGPAGRSRVSAHIVHHSSADALPLLRQAREEGLPMSAETCPHYLCLAAEEIPDGATQFKCCPPIRERENCARLWAALREGLIEMVVSDHSPCPPEMKLPDEGDFLRAWGGISSVQLRLPVMWTAAQKRGYGFLPLVEWLCRAPAKLAGLDARKGSLRAGCDADVVVWNPEATFRVRPEALHDRHKLTPYEGRVLRGVVEMTFLRGQEIYARGKFAEAPAGTLLQRGPS